MATRLKIVVVDDSTVVLKWVESALAELYEVVTLSSAVDAAPTIFREKPDLVLLDVKMPVLRGDHIIDLVRESSGSKPTPVVLFSSLSRDELEEKTKASGADGFIQKGGDIESFRRQVATVLARGPSPISSRKRADDDKKTAATEETQALQRALLAGEDTTIRDAARMLESKFEVTKVESGAAVLAALRDVKPSVLIVGPDLADMTVMQLCSAVRSDPMVAKVSILFVGSTSDEKRASMVVVSGANHALNQPFDESTFFDAIGRLTRISPRRASRLMVRVEVGVGSDKAFHMGFSRNISASGMLLESDFAPGDGDSIKMRFFVPGREEEIVTDAEVVRVSGQIEGKAVFAVRFVNIVSESGAVIDEFVRSGG